MTGWSQYSLEDFVPFSDEVYFRLLERVNEAYWPLQPFMLLPGLILSILLVKGCYRTAALGLAAVWLWVGYAFLYRYYAHLNWAGPYFVAAFWLQSLIVLVAARINAFGALHHEGWGARQALAGLLILTGLAYPLLTLATGRPWSQAELFGLHPDPTAILTLGLLLLAARTRLLLPLAVVPLLWCLVTGLTLRVLAAPWYGWPLVIAALYTAAAVGHLWRLWHRGHRSQPP